jgi:hypothetical protein
MSVVAAKYFSAGFSFLDLEFYKGGEAQGWGRFSVQRLAKPRRLPLQMCQLQASKSIAQRHFSIK